MIFTIIKINIGNGASKEFKISRADKHTPKKVHNIFFCGFLFDKICESTVETVDGFFQHRIRFYHLSKMLGSHAWLWSKVTTATTNNLVDWLLFRHVNWFSLHRDSRCFWSIFCFTPLSMTWSCLGCFFSSVLLSFGFKYFIEIIKCNTDCCQVSDLIHDFDPILCKTKEVKNALQWFGCHSQIQICIDIEPIEGARHIKTRQIQYLNTTTTSWESIRITEFNNSREI